MSTLEELDLQMIDLFMKVKPHVSMPHVESLPGPRRRVVLERMQRGVELDSKWRRPRLKRPTKILSDRDLLPAYVAFDQSSAVIFNILGKQIAIGQTRFRPTFCLHLSNGPGYASTRHEFSYEITVPTSFGSDIVDYVLTDRVVPAEGEGQIKLMKPPEGKSLYGREMTGHLTGFAGSKRSYLVEGPRSLYYGGVDWPSLDPITRVDNDGVLTILTRDPDEALAKVKGFLAKQDPLHTARLDVDRMFAEWYNAESERQVA